MDKVFLAQLETIVGADSIVRDRAELATYESDGLVKLRSKPGVVVLPGTADEVQRVVRLCHEHDVPFVARGHGTGLSGGALPLPAGVLIVMTRLNRILDIDIPNQRITVEPGVMNLDVTKAVESEECYYAPDPSSQVICSIGGNVAENSGGAHCLKYGFTVHHVLGVEAVLPDGSMVRVGGSALDNPGLDLLGILVGSEGTLAVVTKVILRLLRKPASVKTLLAAFESVVKKKKNRNVLLTEFGSLFESFFDRGPSVLAIVNQYLRVHRDVKHSHICLRAGIRCWLEINPTVDGCGQCREHVTVYIVDEVISNLGDPSVI